MGSEEGGPCPPGLSPPPGGLLGWPQTHSLDTREGRAVCRSGHVSLCGPARPWVLTVLGDGPSGPSPRKGPSRPAEQGQEMPWRPGDSLVLDVTWLPPTATAVQTQGPCSRGAVCGSSLGYRAVWGRSGAGLWGCVGRCPGAAGPVAQPRSPGRPVEAVGGWGASPCVGAVHAGPAARAALALPATLPLLPPWPADKGTPASASSPGPTRPRHLHPHLHTWADQRVCVSEQHGLFKGQLQCDGPGGRERSGSPRSGGLPAAFGEGRARGCRGPGGLRGGLGPGRKWGLEPGGKWG